MDKWADLAVEVQDLSVAYGQRVALWDVAFSLPKGQLAGIIGPNGAGKSTLLQALMGLVPMRTGRVRLMGQPYQKKLGNVAYVPQRESVDWDFPASVEEVVMMGRYGRLGLFSRPGKKDRKAVEEALSAVEMLDYRRQQIGELSGGQQQRTFLARALVQEADLYLMDEPMAGVDARSEAFIFELLKKMAGEGKGLLIVFHNLHAATKYFDRLLLLNKRLIASGETREVFTEQNLRDTYGPDLPLLAEVGRRLAAQGFPDASPGI